MTVFEAGHNLPVVRNSANESWFQLIWLKRLLPLLVIALAVGGYFLWDKLSTKWESEEENRLAQVTAQVWIATAKYRNEPAKYLAYRDSLLKAADVPREKVLDFLKGREKQPEHLLPFAQKVQRVVDSLYRIEDSLAREAIMKAQDSLRAAARAADSVNVK